MQQAGSSTVLLYNEGRQMRVISHSERERTRKEEWHKSGTSNCTYALRMPTLRYECNMHYIQSTLVTTLDLSCIYNQLTNLLFDRVALPLE